MRRTLLTSALAAVAILAACGEDATHVPSGEVGTGGEDAAAVAEQVSPLRYTMTRLNGREDDLSRYVGKVVLVVNTATECGFTPQFKGLEGLYEKRHRQGLVVLGFPSNDFAGQEPRSERDIGKFCRANYGVTFPMFSKTNVTGTQKAALFRDLGEPSWNFNKYLLDRSGKLVQRWGAETAPDDPTLQDAVSREL